MKPRAFATGAMAAFAAVVLAACGSSGTSGSGSSSKSVAGGMILGAAPEFKTRTDGLSGLKKVYGVNFGAFKPLDAGGPLTVGALKNGQIDAGNIFSTDPSISANGFVTLTDPKGLVEGEAVLPLIAKKAATPDVTETLDAVSGKLTTDNLKELVKRVEVDKDDAETVASDFIDDQGLGSQ